MTSFFSQLENAVSAAKVTHRQEWIDLVVDVANERNKLTPKQTLDKLVLFEKSIDDLKDAVEIYLNRRQLASSLVSLETQVASLPSLRVKLTDAVKVRDEAITLHKQTIDGINAEIARLVGVRNRLKDNRKALSESAAGDVRAMAEESKRSLDSLTTRQRSLTEQVSAKRQILESLDNQIANFNQGSRTGSEAISSLEVLSESRNDCIVAITAAESELQGMPDQVEQLTLAWEENDRRLMDPASLA